MARKVIGKQRLATITQLNKQATRKINRLKTKYDVDVDVVVKDPSTFSSIREYNNYIKRLQTFTDRKNYRYIKLEVPSYKYTSQFDVVDYSEYQDWARQQRLANKNKRKALKQRLEWINKGQKKQYTLKEIEQNQILAKRLNVASLTPSKVNTKTFAQRFETIAGVERSKQALLQRNINTNYFNDRDAKAKGNFNKALFDTFTDIVPMENLDALAEYVDSLSLTEWQMVLYTFREDPFQYLYERGANIWRFVQTVKKFRIPKDIEDQILKGLPTW